LNGELTKDGKTSLL